MNRRAARHAPARMTQMQLRSAAFQAVILGRIEKMTPDHLASIARQAAKDGTPAYHKLLRELQDTLTHRKAREARQADQ